MKEFSPFEVVVSKCKSGCCYKAEIVWAEGSASTFLNLRATTMKLPGVRAAVDNLCKTIAEGLSQAFVKDMKDAGAEVECKVVKIKPHECN